MIKTILLGYASQESDKVRSVSYSFFAKTQSGNNQTIRWKSAFYLSDTQIQIYTTVSSGGDNIVYKAYTPTGANQDAINFNLDKEVELDLGDLISVGDISLEMGMSDDVAEEVGVSDYDIMAPSSEF